MERYQCLVCLISTIREGDPDSGIAPGTTWVDVPEDWICPQCGVAKICLS